MAGATLLQGGNFLIPLALLPILTKALGVTGYGEFSYVNAVIQYFILITDWGFALTATRHIAVDRADRSRLSEVFWATVFSRSALCVSGYIVLEVGCWILAVPALLYRCAFLAVCSVAISPVFFYQGKEQLGRVALINTLIKAAAIPTVWLVVSDDQDLMWALLIPAFFSFIASAICFAYLLNSGEIDAPHVKKLRVFSFLVEGWPLFLSTASVSLYTNSNVVILGLMAGPEAVGFFSGAMLIVRAVQGVYQPISQVFFSKLSHAFRYDKERGSTIFRQLLIWQGSSTLIISLVLIVVSPYVMTIVLGPHFESDASVIRWLSLMVFFVGLSNVFGIQGMLPLGYNSAFARILLVSGVLNIVLVVPMSYFWSAQGAAIAVVITELLITSLMGWYLYQQEPALFRRAMVIG